MDDHRPVEKCDFLLFLYKSSYFSSKCVYFYILVVLLSYYDDFLHFKTLSRKWTKLKFLIDDRGPVKKFDFMLFSQMFIFFIQMSECLHFSYPAVIP